MDLPPNVQNVSVPQPTTQPPAVTNPAMRSATSNMVTVTSTVNVFAAATFEPNSSHAIATACTTACRYRPSSSDCFAHARPNDPMLPNMPSQKPIPPQPGMSSQNSISTLDSTYPYLTVTSHDAVTDVNLTTSSDSGPEHHAISTIYAADTTTYEANVNACQPV